jgi:hypothetical protein
LAKGGPIIASRAARPSANVIGPGDNWHCDRACWVGRSHRAHLQCQCNTRLAETLDHGSLGTRPKKASATPGLGNTISNNPLLLFPPRQQSYHVRLSSRRLPNQSLHNGHLQPHGNTNCLVTRSLLFDYLLLRDCIAGGFSSLSINVFASSRPFDCRRLLVRGH